MAAVHLEHMLWAQKKKKKKNTTSNSDCWGRQAKLLTPLGTWLKAAEKSYRSRRVSKVRFPQYMGGGGIVKFLGSLFFAIAAESF